MLKQTSENFKKLFLLRFTKELIDAHSPEDIAKLEKILKKEEKQTPTGEKTIKKIVKNNEKRNYLKERTSNLKENINSLKRMKPILRIPETRLPSTFQYLKPTPTNTQIDLGVLNPFIKDPLVQVIECSGPNNNIIVHGRMGRKPTKIMLKKEEIEDIINKFSQVAKIPVDEGVFKAVVGRLILSAIVSKTVGSKFVIRKMAPPQRYY